MNLTLFFKLITQVLFHEQGISVRDGNFKHHKPEYNRDHFFCPRVHAMDGFSVSLQINYGNYCQSENGYRKLGKEWIMVEFGFPTENEPLMHQYSEMWESTRYEFDDEGNDISQPFNAETFDVTGTVGSIPVSVMEEVFAKHGGIDWVKSCEFEEIK